jgi:hypothetical protein
VAQREAQSAPCVPIEPDLIAQDTQEVVGLATGVIRQWNEEKKLVVVNHLFRLRTILCKNATPELTEFMI